MQQQFSILKDGDLDAIEGKIVQSLFRTNEDSSSDESEDGNRKTDGGNVGVAPLSSSSPNPEFTQYQIMNITLEEQTIGGSISQRLWPAATQLANFVMLQLSSSSLAPRPLAPTTIIELGAGVGLTGLQLATFFDCRVLLTDLPDAMPLLEKNIELNRKLFRLGPTAVHSQVLRWGEQSDAQAALKWAGIGPFLILASDCVYFPQLHLPLEQSLSHLLQAQPGSKCWIAGMRRWKSDNAFYKNLGRRTKTPTHQLTCECMEETVTRTDENRREIIRVFSIEWLERTNCKT